MKMFIYNVPYQRKLLITLCVLSMLLINIALADGSLRKSAPEIEIVEPIHASAPAGLEGAFESVRIDHDVTVSGKKGMQIHAKFSVKNGLNVQCLMIAYFYSKDGAPIKADPNSEYRTSSGNVSPYTTFTPKYDSSAYNDLQIFLPYSALNLKGSGVHDLKLYLALYGQGNAFAKSTWYNFRITKS